MAWKIELVPAAERELDKLDPQQAKRVLKFLFERVAKLKDPRSIGEALKGSRLGDYRIICNIDDTAILILVVKVGNRREVYR